MTTTPTPIEDQPISRVQWVDPTTLRSNAWNPNRVHKAELRLLERSLIQTGWLQPLMVNPDGLVIDGFHRWRLAQDSKRVQDALGPLVPVVVLDLPEPEAMLQTIRINRAKGTHVAVHMSAIVRSLVQEHGYDPKQIAEQIGATLEEVAVLAQDGVFEVRNIGAWAYSPAWYPEKLAPGQKHQEKPERAPAGDPIPASPHPAGTGIA